MSFNNNSNSNSNSNSLSELTNNSLSELTNNSSSVMSNLTNEGGDLTMIDIKEKFIADYDELFESDGGVDGFKNAFHGFYANFIEYENLNKIYKLFKNKKNDVEFFFNDIAGSLLNIYLKKMHQLKQDEQNDVSKYILVNRKNALNAINNFEPHSPSGSEVGGELRPSPPIGGKRRKKRKGKTKKQKKTKRKQTKRKKTKRKKTKKLI